MSKHKSAAHNLHSQPVHGEDQIKVVFIVVVAVVAILLTTLFLAL